MAEDARVRYTKMVIRKSFITLINQKPFSKITLKEVCQLAQINHSTFYRYYSDIYDWKKQLEEDSLAYLEWLIHNTIQTSRREMHLSNARALKENKDVFQAMISPNFESGFMQKVDGLYFQLELEEAQKKKGSDLTQEEYWNCYYKVSGMNGVIQQWVRSGMKESPEELTDYLIKKDELFSVRTAGQSA